MLSTIWNIYSVVGLTYVAMGFIVAVLLWFTMSPDDNYKNKWMIAVCLGTIWPFVFMPFRKVLENGTPDTSIKISIIVQLILAPAAFGWLYETYRILASV